MTKEEQDYFSIFTEEIEDVNPSNQELEDVKIIMKKLNQIRMKKFCEEIDLQHQIKTACLSIIIIFFHYLVF
jgi:hypothetical protein